MELRSSLARLHDFIGADGPRSSWWRRSLWYLIELGPLTYQKTVDDKAPQMAAALTYHTLFSLLPTLVLTLVVAKAFITEEQLRELKEDTVGWTLQWIHTPAEEPAPPLPDAVEEVAEAGTAVAEAMPGGGASDAVEELTDPAPPAAAPFGGFLAAARQAAADARAQAQAEISEHDGERLKAEFNETAAKLDQSLQELLDRLQNISFASIGVAGVLLFIYGATTLLSTVEQSFNFILRNPAGRPWHMRFVIYFTTLILAPLVLVAGQVGQRTLISMLQSGSFTNWIVPVLIVLSPLVTTWLVLFALYRLLPNGSMRLVPAAIGSLVAAVALGVTTSLFGYYVANTGTTSLYGAMALLPLFLMLLWIVWQIVLFGLEMGTVIQRLPAHREATSWGRADPLQARATMPDPRLLIPVAAELAASFGEGRTATPGDLARRVGLTPDTLQVLLDRLVSRGDAHRLPGDEPAYALARPAGAIPLPALLDETITLGRRGMDSRAETLLAELDDAERATMEGRTLADLAPEAAPRAAAARVAPEPAVASEDRSGEREDEPESPRSTEPPARRRRRLRLPFGRSAAPAPPPEREAPIGAPAAPEPSELPPSSASSAHDTATAGDGDAVKGERGDLNPRPPGSQPGALTN